MINDEDKQSENENSGTLSAKLGAKRKLVFLAFHFRKNGNFTTQVSTVDYEIAKNPTSSQIGATNNLKARGQMGNVVT